MVETTDAPLPTPEERFAVNMKALRESEGWNQSELARRITEAGLSGFHQTTVSRIEKGERPVRLGEATVIASVFRVPVERLTGDPQLLAKVAEIRSAHARAQESRSRLVEAAHAFDDAIQALRLALEDPDPGGDYRAHSPWTVENRDDPFGPTGAGKFHVIHDGFDGDSRFVAQARQAVPTIEAFKIDKIVNDDARDVVSPLYDLPF